jgi:hypothetical protein
MNTKILVHGFFIYSISIILPIHAAERPPTPFPSYEDEQSRELAEETERLIKQSNEKVALLLKCVLRRPLPHRLPKCKPLSINILFGLNIITNDESEAIQTYFQTLTDLLQATPTQLLELEGITEVTVKRIERGLLGCNSTTDSYPISLGLRLHPGKITHLAYYSILRTLCKMKIIGMPIFPEEFIRSYEITPPTKKNTAAKLIATASVFKPISS